MFNRLVYRVKVCYKNIHLNVLSERIEMKKDYYELLGVQKGASADEIKRAFRVKAKECHPDHHPGDKAAEQRFKEINEAYDVLKDPQKKAAYDQYGHAAFTSGMGGAGGAGFGGFDFSGTGFESIFEEMFSNFGGASRSRRNTQSAPVDMRYDLAISLEEAYAGLKKKIKVESYVPCEKCGGKGGKDTQTCGTCGGQGRVRQRQGFFVVETECPVCHGTGKSIKDPCSACQGVGRVRKTKELEVNIPKGVDSGVRMRLSGEGSVGMRGQKAGDLYVFLTVKKHAVFEREGDNLYCEMPIPMTIAALGGKVIVPTVDGHGAEVEIKAGTQTGAQIKIKGKGMPRLRSDVYGDLFVTLVVETPKNLTARQKELLKEFEAEGKNAQSAYTDFLNKVKDWWDAL